MPPSNVRQQSLGSASFNPIVSSLPLQNLIQPQNGPEPRLSTQPVPTRGPRFSFDGQGNVVGGPKKGFFGDITSVAEADRESRLQGIFNQPGVRIRPGLTSPGFQSVVFNPDTADLFRTERTNVDLAQIDPNSLESFDLLRNLASQSATDDLRDRITGRARDRLTDDLGAISASQTGALEQGLNALATRGGVSQGSRTNLAAALARDSLRNRQAARRGFADQAAGIDIDTEKLRRDAVGNFSNVEAGIAQTNLDAENRRNLAQADLDNRNQLADIEIRRGEVQDLRNFLLERFRTEADVRGAEEQARATTRAAEASRPRGGLLGGNIIPGIL